MKRILVAWLVLIQFSLYSQGISDINGKIDSLKSLRLDLSERISEMTKEIKSIDNQIDDLMNQLSHIESKSADQIDYMYTGSYDVILSEKVDKNNMRDIVTVPPDERVIFLEYDEVTGHNKVKYQDHIGWAPSWQFKRSSLEYDKKTEKKKLAQQEEYQRLDRLKTIYGSEIASKIIAQKIWIGMTNEMARYSWGEPIEINRTVGSWGVNEQWVYSGDVFLYFENGILTSWQD